VFYQGYYEDCISRAYYSMYLAAKALLKTRKIEVKTHKGVISKFGSEFIEDGTIEKEYSKSIHKIEELREESDYLTFRKITEKEAKTVILDAKKFRDRIKIAINNLK